MHVLAYQRPFKLISGSHEASLNQSQCNEIQIRIGLATYVLEKILHILFCCSQNPSTYIFINLVAVGDLSRHLPVTYKSWTLYEYSGYIHLCSWLEAQVQ